MRKTVITTIIIVVVTLSGLFVFTKVSSKADREVYYAEAKRGPFEITVETTGELVAENSVIIMAPDIQSGRDVRSAMIKITDLVPEGTEVKEGDYIATLDRTEFDNQLKEFQTSVATMKSQVEMQLLDTAVQLNSIRDQITNQIHTIEEAEIKFRNSKYEPPTTLRQAEINLDQAKRQLEQLLRSYELRKALLARNIKNREVALDRILRQVNDYEEILNQFVIKAPAPGMVIYTKDRTGAKRKVGSQINNQDRAVATLPDLSSMLSKVFINEVEIAKIKPGLKVKMSVDAFPDKGYTGTVQSIANIGEKLPNTDSKVFEVLIKLDGSDYTLRPAMTTNNKILVESFDNVVYIPAECVHTGVDSIPYVYTRNGQKKIVLLGEANEEDVIVEKGLEEGTVLHITAPADPEKFKLTGKELIPEIRKIEKEKSAMNTVK
jgi:multidrug efflux pump subunit AcrA (membrane-fusion protein)